MQEHLQAQVPCLAVQRPPEQLRVELARIGEGGRFHLKVRASPHCLQSAGDQLAECLLPALEQRFRGISQHERACRRLRTACARAAKLLASPSKRASIEIDGLHGGRDLRSSLVRGRPPPCVTVDLLGCMGLEALSARFEDTAVDACEQRLSEILVGRRGRALRSLVTPADLRDAGALAAKLRAQGYEFGDAPAATGSAARGSAGSGGGSEGFGDVAVRVLLKAPDAECCDPAGK